MPSIQIGQEPIVLWETQTHSYAQSLQHISKASLIPPDCYCSHQYLRNGKNGFWRCFLMQWKPLAGAFSLHRQLSFLWNSLPAGFISDKEVFWIGGTWLLSQCKLPIDSGPSHAGNRGSSSALLQELCKGVWQNLCFSFPFLLPLSASKHTCSGCLHTLVHSCRRS